MLRCFFCLRCKPSKFAPLATAKDLPRLLTEKTRLYRDDLVDLLFTKAKVPGFFGWEKHEEILGSLGIVIPPYGPKINGDYFTSEKVAENKWVSHGFTVFFTTVNGMVGTCTYGAPTDNW